MFFPLEFNKLINFSFDVFELMGHCHQLLIDKKVNNGECWPFLFVEIEVHPIMA